MPLIHQHDLSGVRVSSKHPWLAVRVLPIGHGMPVIICCRLSSPHQVCSSRRPTWCIWCATRHLLSCVGLGWVRLDTGAQSPLCSVVHGHILRMISIIFFIWFLCYIFCFRKCCKTLGQIWSKWYNVFPGKQWKLLPMLQRVWCIPKRLSTAVLWLLVERSWKIPVSTPHNSESELCNSSRRELLLDQQLNMIFIGTLFCLGNISLSVQASLSKHRSPDLRLALGAWLESDISRWFVRGHQLSMLALVPSCISRKKKTCHVRLKNTTQTFCEDIDLLQWNQAQNQFQFTYIYI